jgi:hypothetical protein
MTGKGENGKGLMVEGKEQWTGGKNETGFLKFFLSFFILYYDQPIHNYFTNYHTATCFDTIVSSSDSL